MNIYVANLNFRAEDTDLKKLFENYGTVNSAKIVTDKETHRSRGFGFIEMPNENEALDAINNLHEHKFMDRELIVNEARPQKKFENSDRRDRGNGGNSNYKNRDNNNHKSNKGGGKKPWKGQQRSKSFRDDDY